MYLKEMRLKRFMGFEDFTIEFDPLTVLVSTNNSGKTSLLKAIEFAMDIFSGSLDQYRNLPAGARTETGKMPISTPPAILAKRAGIERVEYLRYKRNVGAESIVGLTFEVEGQPLCVEVGVAAASSITMRIHYKGVGLHERPKLWPAVKKLANLGCYLIRPIGEVPASERQYDYPAVTAKLADGDLVSVWRNEVFYLQGGRHPDAFRRTIDRLHRYFPDAELDYPRVTREAPPSVAIGYEEDGSRYDISQTGDGHRNLSRILALCELLGQRIVLFDEPDAHLHSKVQRDLATYLVELGMDKKQIVIATHSPDMINEFPLESLRWIDRRAEHAEPCSDVGRTLLALGTVNPADAIAAVSRKNVLLLEGKLDRQIFCHLMERCGHGEVLDNVEVYQLRGVGNAKHAPLIQRILKDYTRRNIKVAVAYDMDYGEPVGNTMTEEKEGVLYLQLPCKELENLLLLKPNSLAAAAKGRAEEQATWIQDTPQPPAIKQIEKRIDEIIGSQEISDCVRNQLTDRYLKEARGDGEKKIKEATTKFNELWGDPASRRRFCPGKQVLARLQDWLREHYRISLGARRMFSNYEPDDDLRKIFERLADYFDINKA